MSEQYTLQDFADLLAEQLGTPKGKTYEASKLAFGMIASHLSKGGRAALHTFGTFYLVARRARKGRNPRTGEIIPIPARKIVAFKPAKPLRDNVSRAKKPKK